MPNDSMTGAILLTGALACALGIAVLGTRLVARLREKWRERQLLGGSR